MKKIRLDFYLTDSSKYLDANNSIDDLKEKLSYHFENYDMGFSINNQIGGYLSENGEYVVENSLKISVIGFYAKKDVDEFVKIFKQIYNQESVLVCKQELECNYY